MYESNVVNPESRFENAQDNIDARVFRVFISSTFVDMQDERNRLVQNVFPRIRKLCKERDVEFVPIDLRWGVTEEQKATKKALGICLREVQRSRPFFIGFLGERYGWKPTEEDVDQADFDAFPFLKEDLQNRLSICEIGFQFGALNVQKPTAARFWLRSEKMETPEEFREEESPEKLVAFKARLRAQSVYPVAEYVDLKDFGTQVEDALKALLDKYFPATQKRSWFRKQDDEQRVFERYRSKLYVENVVEYDKLNAFVESGESVRVVVGASGLGKSSLLANWKLVCAEKFPDVKIITHYVAASENSDLPANILSRLTKALDPSLATEKESQLDLKFEQNTLDNFSNEFAVAVAQYLQDNPGKRLLFVIDELNQLSETDDAKELGWLPPLPEGAQYLLSTVPSDRTWETIKRRGWKHSEIHALDQTQRSEIVKRFLASRGRSLTTGQLNKILNFSLASNPLVLKTLLDELCVFGVYRKFDEEIDRYVGAQSVDDFFDKVFERLESNEQFIETDPQKRKEIVEKLATLLALSRFGLTENELGAVSEYDQLTLSTFLCALDAQLVNRSGRYTFGHDYIRRAVLNRYAEKIVDTRRLLIDKFLELEPEDERRLQEVPFQYLQLEFWEELRLFLLDFDILDKLYNGTFNCDFCTYWNAATRNGRNEFCFASYLNLNSSKPANWHKLARIAEQYREFPTAKKAYKEALTFYRRLAEEDPNKYKSALALTLNNLANFHNVTNNFDEAEKEYKETLALYRPLAEENPNSYKPGVAMTLNNLAVLHFSAARREEAETEARGALTLYRQLASERPNVYKPDVAKTLNNLANFHMKTSRLDEAEKEYEETLKIRRQLAKERPKAYNSDVASSLNNLANLHFSTKRPGEAENEYREALALYRQLEEENPGIYRPDVAMTLNNLAKLHSITNRLDEAEEEYKEALEIRRELAEKYPGVYKLEFAQTLFNAASFCFLREKTEDAIDFLSKALPIFEEFAKISPVYEKRLKKARRLRDTLEFIRTNQPDELTFKYF